MDENRLAPSQEKFYAYLGQMLPQEESEEVWTEISRQQAERQARRDEWEAKEQARRGQIAKQEAEEKAKEAQNERFRIR